MVAPLFFETFQGGYSQNWAVGMPWEAGTSPIGTNAIQSDPAVTPAFNPFSTSAAGLAIKVDRTNGATGSGGKAYYRGLLSSKASRVYGYYEFVAAMPNGPGGANGALWLYPTGPSNNAEIDVIEHIAGYVMQTVWDGSGTNPTQATNVPNVTSLHTYAVNWQSDFITFYIDGVQKFQTVTPANSKTVPMMVILSMNVGADIGTDGTVLPAIMTVKSVGIWTDKAARDAGTQAPSPTLPVSSKVAATLLQPTSSAAGATTTSGVVDLSRSAGATLFGSVTNGATGPTTPCNVTCEVSSNGTTFSLFNTALSSVANGASSSSAFNVPAGYAKARLTFAGHTGQPITCSARVQYTATG